MFCKYMGANDPRARPFLTPGAWLAGFIKKTTTHCYTQNMKALGLVVSEKNIFFLCFSHDAHGAWPVWTPEARLAGCFSHCKSMGANDPRSGAIFDPRGMVGRIYKGEHYTLLHTKYESSGPCGFGEENFFFMLFPWRLPGWSLYRPQGHGWQDL